MKKQINLIVSICLSLGVAMSSVANASQTSKEIKINESGAPYFSALSCEGEHKIQGDRIKLTVNLSESSGDMLGIDKNNIEHEMLYLVLNFHFLNDNMVMTHLHNKAELIIKGDKLSLKIQTGAVHHVLISNFNTEKPKVFWVKNNKKQELKCHLYASYDK